MLTFAALPSVSVFRHATCITIACLVFVMPLFIAFMLSTFLPVDLWFVMVVSNCTLTSVQTASTSVMYLLTIIERRNEYPKECFDSLMFTAKMLGRLLEVLLSASAVAYGGYASIVDGQWTVLSTIVIVFYIYFNVWRRVYDIPALVKARNTAASEVRRLSPVTEEEVRLLGDICAICHDEMEEDAVRTTCMHIFHG
ncbi:TRC8 N-terminal domain containing protein [Aphelenchoides avenae]|nr:TRC8 N-terminal domain containing protein [Aphelenchus avenae]